MLIHENNLCKKKTKKDAFYVIYVFYQSMPNFEALKGIEILPLKFSNT